MDQVANPHQAAGAVSINLTTPALLFPAVSLLLLAYTNRFLALAALIRTLHARYQSERDDLVAGQIAHLKRRVVLIRWMQELGVISLLLCVAAMFCLFAEWRLAGEVAFAVSLLMLLSSLAVSAREIHISVHALTLQIQDMK